MVDNSVEIVLVASQLADYQEILEQTNNLVNFPLTFRKIVTWSELALLDNLPDNTEQSLSIYLIDQTIWQNQTAPELSQVSDHLAPHPVIFITNPVSNINNDSPVNSLDLCQLNITDTFTKEELTPEYLARYCRLTLNIHRQFQKKLAENLFQQNTTNPTQIDLQTLNHHTIPAADDLEQAYHNLQTAGAIADETGLILRANQQFCELVGYSESELQTMSWPQITYPPDLVLQKTYNQNILAGVISSYTM